MAKMDDLDILIVLTGESDESILSIFMQIAEERLLYLTNRTMMIPRLQAARRDWAVIAYNRWGMEGETSRSQGGISSVFAEIPKEIENVIHETRIARVGGKVHEKAATQDQEEPVETIPSQEEDSGEG